MHTDANTEPAGKMHRCGDGRWVSSMEPSGNVDGGDVGHQLLIVPKFPTPETFTQVGIYVKHFRWHVYHSHRLSSRLSYRSEFGVTASDRTSLGRVSRNQAQGPR